MEDSANKDKKKPQRRRKARAASQPEAAASTTETVVPPNVDIEYVVDDTAGEAVDDEGIKAAFERLTGVGAQAAKAESHTDVAATSNDDAEDAGATPVLDEDGNVISKSMLRRLHRPTVAQLKQNVSRSGIVEVVDTTASDPELLIFLKGMRAAVPVPRHWQTSTKFLSGKRGSERIKYELPEYIANTGITKLRDASDTSASDIKTQMRERVKPKMGRIDIDYQVLHDAFFKLQTMPRLTRHGELYFEGKEFEKDPSKFVPGVLSDELRKALGMPTTEREGSAAAQCAPPPWLTNMQRLGPPPSYPGASFPGVNAPIPAGAHYGMHTGGWGKPPVDQFGRSLYGDVFGVAQSKVDMERHIDKKFKWGGFTREDVDEPAGVPRRPDDDDDEDEDEAGGDAAPVIVALPVANRGPSIVDTPIDAPVDLRKRAAPPLMPPPLPPPPPPSSSSLSSAAPASVSSMAHRILEMATVSATEKGLFAAGHTYSAPPVVQTSAPVVDVPMPAVQETAASLPARPAGASAAAAAAAAAAAKKKAFKF